MIAAILGIAVGLAGCAASPRTPRSAARPSAAPAAHAPKDLIRLPLVRQSTPYTCGAAALQSILGYYGEDIREDELARKLGSDPEQGTRYWKIVELAREHGIDAKAALDAPLEDLTAALDAGKPVIVAFQAWAEGAVDYAGAWDDGHYAVAIGHDERNLYFMDPSTLGNYAFIPKAEFLVRWHDQYDQTRVNHLMLVFSKAGPAYDPAKLVPLE
ncbi:MAG: C39 family peptidase [Elusimicrobia bacterium]|nr:C39 family peptidase [Elusimicrobiota bacterium]